MKADLKNLSLDDIVSAKVCPYCGNEPARVGSSQIYSFLSNDEFGFMRACMPCRAWVGEHKSGDKAGQPLGRLADDTLRLLKRDAHNYFDQIWKKKMEVAKISKNEARGLGYKWLSEKLAIEPEYCHIGMMNPQQCLKVIQLCKPIVNSWPLSITER